MKHAILALIALATLITSCSPTGYKNDGTPCPPLVYGIPECGDTAPKPEPPPENPNRPAPELPLRQKRAGIRG